MFTGIIRHRGTVTAVRLGAGGSRLSIGCPELAATVVHGASVCVNGVCLTVADMQRPMIEFDVIAETLERSTLKSLRVGAQVNLEPSLRAGDPIDGHLVQGHVDGTAELIRRETTSVQHVLHFKADPRVRPYVIPQGSIALDGVSLTIADVTKDGFSVALIPTTLALTTLAHLREDDRVNVESDVIVRTVIHHLDAHAPTEGLTRDRLRAYGFA